MSLATVLRRAAAPAAFVLAAGGMLASAAIDDSATVAEHAVRLVTPGNDVAVAFDVGPVDREVIQGSGRAANAAGGSAATSRSGSIGLVRVRRDGSTVHAPPSGYLIPLSVVALPRRAVSGVVGPDVVPVLDAGTAVMNELTAGLTGARVGDVVDVRSPSGASLSLRVGAILPYDQIGWAELVFTTDVADRLGMRDDTRVVMWGFDDRAALDRNLAAQGVLGRRDTRVVRSWDPPDPDDTISTVRTKVALGEPWYRIEGDGSLTMHPTWKATNLTDGRVLLNSQIPIRAQCHVGVVDDLRAALADVAAAGLGWAIDAGNANAYGGCYVPRYSRTSGFLSRHTYGMALDTNTVTNCAGCRPRMHCDVVRIFRRHGFAWGGNFRQPDGMHFEWVGEPRDRIAYPSTYCPNIVGGGALADGVEGGTGTGGASVSLGGGVLTAGEAWISDDGHAHD